MSEEIVCSPGRKYCTSQCENYAKCEQIRKAERQEQFNEIMDEARSQTPTKMDFCPCETCIYAGGEVCDLENEEPFKSRKKEHCADWDEGEIDAEY